MELSGKRVLVLGLGISGVSAARFCAERGARVVAADEGAGAAPPALPGGVEVRSAAPFPDPSDFDLVVPSPGVPAERFRGRARRVWGDLELAWRAVAVPHDAATGRHRESAD